MELIKVVVLVVVVVVVVAVIVTVEIFNEDDVITTTTTTTKTTLIMLIVMMTKLNTDNGENKTHLKIYYRKRTPKNTSQLPVPPFPLPPQGNQAPSTQSVMTPTSSTINHLAGRLSLL